MNPGLETEIKTVKNTRGKIKLGCPYTPDVLRVCERTLCKMSQNWPLIFPHFLSFSLILPDHPTLLQNPCQFWHSHTRIWLLQSGWEMQQQFKHIIKNLRGQPPV